MSDWYPYVRALYGAGADDDIEVLFRYRTAIGDEQLQPSDRLEILKWFGKQPPARQLFALPQIAQAFAFGSPAVNAGILDLVDDLLSSERTDDLDLEAIQRGLESATTPDYVAIYERIGALCESAPMPPPGDFSQLQENRSAVALLAILNGLEFWRQARPPAIAEEWRIARAAVEQKLIRRMDLWLRGAHAYGRYLVVRWMDTSGVAAWVEGPPDRVLMELFRHDIDPIVTGAAAEVWAGRRRGRDDVSKAADFLLAQYDTLAAADRRWEPHVDPEEATRELACAFFRAIGRLTLAEPEGRAAQALREIVAAQPNPFINLHARRERMQAQDLRAMFRAALRVRGNRIFVRLLPADDGASAFWGAGRVPIEDPKNLRSAASNPRSFWAKPVVKDADPLTWTFVLDHICVKSDPHVTTNLRRALSPALTYSRTRDPYSVVIVGQKVDVRAGKGGWMPGVEAEGYLGERAAAVADAFKVLVELVARYPDATGSGSLHWVWDALWQMVVVASCASSKKSPSIDRLKRLISHRLLTDLAVPAAFARFLGGDEPRPALEYRAIGSLAASTVTSSPASAAMQWIAYNDERLLGLMRDDSLELLTRGQIALGLLHAHDYVSEYVRRQLEMTPLPAQVIPKFIQAVRFVPEADLAPKAAELDAKAEGWRGPHAELVQWGAIWMERLARWLTDDPDAVPGLDVEQAAEICHRAITATRGVEDFENRVDQLVVRLAYAMGASGSKIESGSLLRLRDQVLRIPKSTILRHYVRGHGMGDVLNPDWVRILVRLLDGANLAESRGDGAPATVQQIVDRLSRRHLIVTELARQAAAGGQDFVRRYVDLRRLDLPKGDPLGWIPSDGEVLAESESEQLAILRHLWDDEPLAVASNISIAAFVDHAPQSQRFRCVATKPPVPPTAIDFHTIDLPPDERMKIALEALRSSGEGGTITAIARLDRGDDDPRWRVDVGLRGVNTWLEGRNHRFGEWRLVKLELVPGATPGAVSIRVKEVEELSALQADVVAGKLTIEPRHGSLGRTWVLAHHHGQIPIARHELTADLETLYAIDAAPDGDERLRPIAVAARQRRVPGEPWSLLTTEPQFTEADLVAATAAGQVDAIVFLGYEEDHGAAVFEIVPVSRRGGRSAIPLFGAMVRLREGTLFDDAGRPFRLRAKSLQRGTRLLLSIGAGILRLDGTLRATTPAEQPLGTAALIVSAVDPVNREIQELFARQRVVRIGRRRDGGPELLDPPQGVPHIFVELDSRATWPRANEFEAVAVGWDPFSPGRRLQVALPETRGMRLGPDALRTVAEWINLRRGEVHYDVRFWPYQNKINMAVHGSRVYVHDSLYWLTPNTPTAEALNNHSVFRVTSVRFTDVPAHPRYRSVGRVARREVPVPDESFGVVVSVPRDATVHTITVLWLDNDEKRVVEARYPIAGDALRNIYPGDLIYAEDHGDEVELFHGTRRLRATPLSHRYRLRESSAIDGTILSEPKEGRFGWLFVTDPGVVLEIPANEIDGDALRGRLLDVARIERARNAAAWRILSVQPGRLATVAEQPFEVQAFSFAAGTFATLRPRHPEFSGWPEIPIRATGRVPRQGERSLAAVHGLKPIVTLEDDEGLSIQLHGILVPPDAARSRELPSLDEELEASDQGRLDEVEGIISADECGESVVRLTTHEHPESLPLSREEETWVPYSALRVQPREQRQSFTAYLENGVAKLSLRRRRPAPLHEWLDLHRLAGRDEIVMPLYFAGAIDDVIRERCGLAADAQGYLLEHAPGDCVIVPYDDFLFRGVPFPRQQSLLAIGEQIVRSRIVRPSPGRVVLDAHVLRHDIAREIQRFSRNDGILIVDTSADRPLKEQLQTMFDNSPEDLSAGDWRLEVASAAEGQAREGRVYARFDRIENGVIHCRALELSDVFKRNNVVYVRGVRTTIGAETSFAEVQPLVPSGASNYTIPDTRYSERRRYLETFDVKGKIFLARVVEEDKHKLALTVAPPRRLGALFRAIADRDQQVIVKHPYVDGVDIEVEPGFNTYLPASRLASPELARTLKKGDVLTLRLNRLRSRIEVTDHIPSHREQLRSNLHPTVLVDLWGSPKHREEKLKKRKPLEANIVGFPQLKARSNVGRDLYLSEDIFPQIVEAEDPQDEFIDLANRVGQDVEVGWVDVESGQPVLRREQGASLQLSWPRTTYAFACRDVLGENLRSWRWRNFAMHDLTGTNKSPAIAYGHRESVSLTAAAARTCPVDHLIEQFGTPRDSLQRFTAIVARASSSVIVLEIAPGRYVDLPTAMIEPVEKLAPGCSSEWSWLHPGDRVHLEVRRLETRRYLPNLCITHVDLTPLRHLRKAVGPLRRDGDHVLFGPEGKGAIHIDDLLLLDDWSLDLRALPVERRLDALEAAWAKAHTRVVLRGVVVPVLSDGGGAAIDVGIPLPGKPFVTGETVVGTTPESDGVVAGVRLLDLHVAGGGVRSAAWRIENPAEATALVRITGATGGAHVRLPFHGDVAMLYAPAAPEVSDVRLCGLESFTIDWNGMSRDPLRLDRLPTRQAVFAKLLGEPGSVLWVTIENVDLRERVIRISRARQLQMIPRVAGGTLRATVLGGVAIEGRSEGGTVLVDVAGVPLPIAPADLCHGLRDAVEYADFLARASKRAQLDVVPLPDGRFSAVDAHPRSEARDLPMTVQFISSTGVVCVHDALPMRVFVPIAALSWCKLTPEAMKSIFRNKKMFIRRTRDDYGSFSYAKIGRFIRAAKDLAQSVERLRPRVDQRPQESDPIFVTRRYVQAELGVSVVETASGMLIGLRHKPGEDLPKHFAAYVEEVDLRRGQITTIPMRFTPCKWRFVHARPQRSDLECEEELKAAVRRLLDGDMVLPSVLEDPIAALWLPPSPRSVRWMLEVVHAAGCVPHATHPAPSAFGRVWLEIGAVLNGTAPQPISALASFGAGYWYLLGDRASTALPYLQAAIASDELSRSFDVNLSLARAVYRENQLDGTRHLRSACRRLIAWAHGTLRPHPLPARPTLSAGAASAIHEVWEVIARRAALGAEFDRRVADFLEALADDQDLGIAVDPALYSFAALVSFSCGDIDRGRLYLDKTRSTASEALQVERSWAAWLSIQPAVDGYPLIERIRELMTTVLWRRVLLPKEAFDDLWKVFRASTQEWAIAPKSYRILAHPTGRGEAARWALAAGAQAALPAVLDWFGEEAEPPQPEAVRLAEAPREWRGAPSPQAQPG